MQKRIIPILITAILFLNCKKQDSKITWTSSSPNKVWEINKVSLNKDKESLESAIIIYPENKKQIIDGFGACFNELGWEALNTISENKKDSILNTFFNPDKGCKFNICRMPIGANDYAVDWYSHNEFTNDFLMEKFSIGRDKKRLIPFIKKALTYNSNIKIWGSPWCPPSWMKTNNHYACNPDPVNNLPETGKGKEMQTQFIMDERYLNAYSLYFSKFIKAYKKEGINIYAVHVQNELNSCQTFPSCIWEPKDIATFIGDYLGPKFQKDSLDTEIWLGTIERPHIERVDSILNNNSAKDYIKGVGFQWAGKGAIPQVNKKYSDLKLMQTETECGDGSNDWKAAEHTFGLMKHYFNNGANSYMYWNMVLNETGKSQWGWKQNSMVTINSKNKSITYNPEFYVMKHFSHFIDAGYYRIETSTPDCLAFKNKKKIVIIYYNSGETEQKTFSLHSEIIQVELKKNSFNTFTINI